VSWAGSGNIHRQTAVKTIFDFLASDTFGFILKLFSGLAAAAFGMLGIGTKTREDSGKLTCNGRIALTGIVIAGLLALGTSIYDFTTGQKKAQQERQREKESRLKGEQLMLSVQRGIYPFKGITVSFSLGIDGDSKLFHEYYDHVARVIAQDPECTRSKDFECVGIDTDNDDLYRIESKSRLFPRAPSLARALIDNAGLRFQLLKQSRSASAPGDVFDYTTLGTFRFRLADRTPEHWFLIFTPGAGHFALRVEDDDLPDNLPISSGIYSVPANFFIPEDHTGRGIPLSG
jgi:hypothetical protein